MNLRQLPNVITVARILLVAPLVWLLHQGDYPHALWVALVAGASDGVDGFLAKRFDWQTRIGGLLDPVADKLLLDASVLTLAGIGALPFWLALLVLGRDLLIIGGATAYHWLIGPLTASPSMVSKITTAAQILLVLASLLQLSSGWPEAIVIELLVVVSAILTVASGADYVLRWSARARREWREKHS